MLFFFIFFFAFFFLLAFFNFYASVCIYLIVLSELLVYMNELSETLFYDIVYIYVLCCNYLHSIGKFLCPHTQTIMIPLF